MSRDTQRRIVFFRSRFFCQFPVSSPQSILCIYAKFLGLLRSILDNRIERIGVEKGRGKQSSGDTRFPVSLGGEPCSESKEISVSRDCTHHAFEQKSNIVNIYRVGHNVATSARIGTNGHRRKTCDDAVNIVLHHVL